MNEMEESCGLFDNLQKTLTREVDRLETFAHQLELDCKVAKDLLQQSDSKIKLSNTKELYSLLDNFSCTHQEETHTSTLECKPTTYYDYSNIVAKLCPQDDNSQLGTVIGKRTRMEENLRIYSIPNSIYDDLNGALHAQQKMDEDFALVQQDAKDFMRTLESDAECYNEGLHAHLPDIYDKFWTAAKRQRDTNVDSDFTLQNITHKCATGELDRSNVGNYILGKVQNEIFKALVKDLTNMKDKIQNAILPQIVKIVLAFINLNVFKLPIMLIKKI